MNWSSLEDPRASCFLALSTCNSSKKWWLSNQKWKANALQENGGWLQEIFHKDSLWENTKRE